MDFDYRLLIVLLPVLAAAGWAVFNIGVLAMQQLQKFLNK
ncbi:MAG: photosystem II protein Y [Trichodesmium sp. MAG_R03]|nr:photosystem II protein Y [Trichodesmium sp. MAG_R03]